MSTPSAFSQLLRSYAYTPQTSLSLKRKRLPENNDCLPVTARKPRASKNTLQASEQHVSHSKPKGPRSESITINQQQVTTGETSIYFTPSGKGASADESRRKGPRKLFDAVEIVVKSGPTVPALSTHDKSLEVSKGMKKKRKLKPVNTHQLDLPAKDDEPSDVEIKIPVTKRYLTPTSDGVQSTLQTLTLPTPSSRPRKRRKVVPSTISLHQSTALSSKSETTSKAAAQKTDVIHRTSPDPTTLTTSKYLSDVTKFGKSWVPSFFPSEDLFTHKNMSAFPTYRQDLFNDLIGYIANAKPILIQGTSSPTRLGVISNLLQLVISAAVSDNLWQLLIAVKLLNVTTGRYAIPVFWKLMDRWPIPRDMIEGRLQLLDPTKIADDHLTTS
jgi:hypothetical protein